MSISPFKLPKPAKHTNRENGEYFTVFLWCLPNSKYGLHFLSYITEHAGINPDIIIND